MTPRRFLVKIDRGGNGAIVEMGEKLSMHQPRSVARWVGMLGVGGRREEGRVGCLEDEDDHESINERREREKERMSTVDCQ